MRWCKAVAAVLFVCSLFLRAALAQSSDPAIQNWESLPEDPGMREICSNTLRYSTAITNLRNQGASISGLLRWAQQQAERSAANVSRDTLASIPTASPEDMRARFQIATMLILTKLIDAAYLDVLDPSVYKQVKGGFPQYAYRSCLKGKPIGQ